MFDDMFDNFDKKPGLDRQISRQRSRINITCQSADVSYKPKANTTEDGLETS